MQLREFEDVKKQVHQKFDCNIYSDTNVRDNTNCYSHAIGAEYPCIRIYRIGVLSGKKSDIKEPYTSFEEIINLLFEDLDSLGLEYEVLDKYNRKYDLKKNQYIIRLYLSKYRDGKIGYHFIRYEDGTWTEKWRGQSMSKIDIKYGIKYDSSWIWNYGCTLRITR